MRNLESRRFTNARQWATKWLGVLFATPVTEMRRRGELDARASGWRGLPVAGFAALALCGCPVDCDVWGGHYGQQVDLLDAHFEGSIGEIEVTRAEAYRSWGTTRGAKWSEAEVRVRQSGESFRIEFNVPFDLRSATVGTVADQGYGWVGIAHAPDDFDYGYEARLAELVTEIEAGSIPYHRRVVFRARSHDGDYVSGAFEIETAAEGAGVAQILAAQVNGREVEAVHYESGPGEGSSGHADIKLYVSEATESARRGAEVWYRLMVAGPLGSLVPDDGGAKVDADPRAHDTIRLSRYGDGVMWARDLDYTVTKLQDDTYELRIDGRLGSPNEAPGSPRPVTATLVFRIPS